MPTQTLPVTSVPSVTLDASQRAVLALPGDASAIVLGVAGSGKTTTLVELAAARLAAGLEPARLLVIAGSRQAATALRDRLAHRTAIVTPGPLARSMPSFAHAVLTAEALADGRPAPQLLSGAEQDRIIAAMLAGHADDAAAGHASGPAWPEHLGAEVREQAGFRAELRELLAAVDERGMTADALARRGHERAVPEWVAAAAFKEEFDRLQRLERRGADAVTAASLLRRAARAVATVDAALLPMLVLVDDAQELTEGAVVVLEALRERGATVIAFGDPDTTTGGFRGADPALLAALPGRLGFGAQPGHRLELALDHRHGPAVRELATRIAGGIGTALAGGQRDARATGGVDAVALHLSASVDDQARRIARLVHERRAAGVPHDGIAVIVRTGRAASELASLLSALDVPVSASGPTRLRDTEVVDALVQVLAVATGRRELTAELAEQLLRSDLLGLDALAVRRLKRALRHRIIADGGEVHVVGAELVRDAVLEPALLEGLRGARQGADAARRLARMLADARALATADDPAAADQVLWAVWSAAGVAAAWQRTALDSGTGVERTLANRRLDAVVALFDQVARLIERRPDADTGAFVDAWLTSSVDDDSLAARAEHARVAIGTPGQFVGRELDTVIVAGLQDGVWPNLRARGSLLGANRLDGDDTVDARAEVLHDELRTFLKAVSTARSAVLLTAVASDDEQPSPFVAGLDPAPEPDGGWHSLRSLVASLRRRAVRAASEGDERDLALAATALRRLGEAGVPGAATGEWAGLAEISSTERLDALDAVQASPSSLQSLVDCEVAWVIDRVAGSTGGQAAGFGTIVHEAVEQHDATDPAQLEHAISARFGELAHESSWEAARQHGDIAPVAATIADYFQRLRGLGWRVESAEHEARFEVGLDGGALLKGSIDWLEHAPDGTVRVVDLKTGKRKPDEHAELGNLQLRAYQLAIALGGIAGVPPEAATEARLFLPRLERREKSIDAEPFTDVRERFEAHLAEAVATMGGAAFRAVPAEHCFERFAHGQCAIHVLPEVTE
ncbi:UrvD/REP family ATP-dependent DNA helicase [Agrococcus beijingensis]|uniref:UrvD/REP family ATP-dependent DNA helicase n=1 Tax=Agrococcus beijingensis TaxID=3068634 RepID=UPI0027419533|nr:UrvD/REP family ATP-dependent DNA helicase [Agrococcus sp. REN33]